MSLFKRIADASGRLYRRLITRQEEPHHQAIVETLRQVPIFQACSRSMLFTLAEDMHSRRYKRDEYLYYENDPGLGLYIVQKGRVRLMTEDEDGQVHELREVGENELFGEISILGDFHRMETAQAMVDTKALGFFSPDVKTMARRNPKTHAALMEALAQYLAARQVELIRQVAGHTGKVAAMRLRDGATLRASVQEGEPPR